MNENLRKKYSFDWNLLEVLLTGKSLIDTDTGLSGFSIRTLEDADRFIKSYGYDLTDPIEMAEALGNFHESIDFIRKFFLKPENSEGLDFEIPKKILEITDIRNLLLMANFSYPGQAKDTQGMILQRWACSILKVVHTIAHMDKDIRYTYFSEIQTQILDRFYKHIHRTDEGLLYLGKKSDDLFRVDLIEFETKPRKSRSSVLLKLLHKKENVAESIFDEVGVRFITHNRTAALRVVKYLKDEMIIMPANVKPSRSRNSLLNLTAIEERLPGLLVKLDSEQLSPEEFERELEIVSEAVEDAHENPHSSRFYRSLQFTCRQLIKLKNPLFEDIRELKKLSKKQEMSEEVLRIISRADLKYIPREIRFFYPFEVQILDQMSADESKKGISAHSTYKQSQIQSALKRVMSALINNEIKS